MPKREMKHSPAKAMVTSKITVEQEEAGTWAVAVEIANVMMQTLSFWMMTLLVLS